MGRTAETTDDEIIDFINGYIEKNHRSPTYRDFVALGMSTPSHARYRVKQLVEVGRLGYTPGTARSIYVKEA